MAEPKIEIYTDRAGEHRWRLKARNGVTIADSGEGYKTPSGAQRAAETVKKTAAKAQVVRGDSASRKPKTTAKKSAAKRSATKGGGGTKKPSSSTKRRSS